MEGQRVRTINPSREKRNVSANHSELPANTGSREEINPRKKSKKPKLPRQNKRVIKAKLKQQGLGKESPPPPPPKKKKKKNEGRIHIQDRSTSNPSLNKRQRKKPRREKTEGLGATRGQGDRMPQKRPQGSPTNRSKKRVQKTATKHPAQPEQVQDKQSQQ